ncbi:L,D-transpeptidase [bacterium]|nr:L,D-transpeptidase [bacterium]
MPRFVLIVGMILLAILLVFTVCLLEKSVWKIDYLEDQLWYSRFEKQHLRDNLDDIAFLEELEKSRIVSLELEKEALQMKGYYLVVNLGECSFELRKGNKILRSGKCGIGKGETNERGKSWDFDTPSGEFHIREKVTDPWWNRPDWFWEERGMAVPDSFIGISTRLRPEDARRAYNRLSEQDKLKVRMVPGYLGKYVLGLGDGILIHYGQELGRRSSHGCIRMSRADVRAIYEVLGVGDPVFIY